MPRRVPRETRPGVELVDIASPYTGTDRVLRRVDSLKQLHGSGIIGDRELRAAEKYRRASERVNSDIRCALASEGGLSKPSSRIPSTASLEAAETYRLATYFLGWVDGTVVSLIVGHGYSISETAAKVFPGMTLNRKEVGQRLRWALRNLADFWFGPELPPRNHMHREADARPQVTNSDQIIPAKVAHASRRGTTY